MTITDAGTVPSESARRYMRMSMTPGAGPVRVRKLVEHFGSLQRVLDASVSDLRKVGGIGGVTGEAIFNARSQQITDEIEREIERATECGVRILCIEDAGFPKPLINTPDPPLVLYVRGTLQPADAVSVAIVGTRRCSHYGREQAERFGEVLGAAGFTVVSGLARGVDSCAHRGAIKGGGRTIAVLGNGLAMVSPQEHEMLAEEISHSGAVLSELPLDIAPDAKNFPPRNRIVAGLSLGVLVIEAGKRSGALITARLATEYNREVFAVPGRIDRPELTAGSNGLIRDSSAKLVTSLEDVLDDLSAVGDIMRRGLAEDAGEAGDTAELQTGLAGNERTIVEAVRMGCHDIESICQEANLDAGSVVAALTKLQIQGHLRRQPGGKFELRSTG